MGCSGSGIARAGERPGAHAVAGTQTKPNVSADADGLCGTGAAPRPGLGERGRRALRHKILLSCAVPGTAPATAARSVTRCQDDAGCSERGFLTTPGIYGDPKSQETWHREQELPSGTSTKTHVKPGVLLELSGLEHRALCRSFHTLFHPWNREQLNCPRLETPARSAPKSQSPFG